MIRSFRCRETAHLVGRREREVSGRHPAALSKLRQLDAAQTPADLRNPPGNRLEALRGDRKGQYSMRINQQWRICFRWRDGEALDVEIVDYH
jgi:proteic killer suppression protein